MTQIFAGAEWVQSSGKSLSPFGMIVADLLGDAFLGIYHISNEVFKTDFTGERYIEMTIFENGNIATFDSDYLTRLVLLSHIRNVRLCIRASTHNYLKLCFMTVDRRGFFADRHPTLTEAINNLGVLQDGDK